MSTPTILLVDDQREITRMLRAALEMTIPGVHVVEVPSAEEAMLEVLRVPFDLVVTDIRLPGMDGFELMQRVRKSRPEAKLIVITGQATPEVEAAVEKLHPEAFFTKPLITGDLLGVAQQVLGLTGGAREAEGEAPPKRLGVGDRLLKLRRDLGASAVYLADVDGRVVVRAGDVPEVDVEGMMVHIKVAFTAAFRVCTMLGGYVPLNIQFFDGDEFDVYVANVGKYFMLLMIFNEERGAQQMGAVMHYGRKAADDLLNLLTEMGVSQEGERRRKSPSVEGDALEAPMPAPVVELSPEPEEQTAEEVEIDVQALEAAAARLRGVDADDFWETALAESSAESLDSHALSFEQARKLGLTPPEEE